MSTDSGQGESLCTPKRVQKRLFGQDVNSTKKNLFQTTVTTNKDDRSSDDESDLGPMSPLEVTDNSSCMSSPGRSYQSSFSTPENSPRQSLSWDRLRLSSNTKKNCGLSPFSSLKKLTRDARATPRRKIFANSPKLLPGTPNKKNLENIVPNTPPQTQIDDLNDDIVPETPQKDSIAGTPQKDFTERRLITPLGSVCKQIIIPPLHRRKSICAFESTDESSPEHKENSGKRHASDSQNHNYSKMTKTDECSIPKARASLFPEEKNEPPKFAPLSTKLFYNNNNNINDKANDVKRVSFGFGWKSVVQDTKKRRSLPAQTRRRSSGSLKRPKLGQINAGVRHGIKRPKPKHHSHKSTKRSEKSPAVDKNDKSIDVIHESVKHVERPSPNKKLKENNMIVETFNDPYSYKISTRVEKNQPIVEDSNKKFFKSNRSVKLSHVAAMTVNDETKLKIADGRIKRQHKKQKVNVNKKPRLEPVIFDTTDLNVDETDDTINEKEVATLLKILEDDWADDEYDSMESVVVNSNARSPTKLMSTSVVNNNQRNLLMSPASVLSTMTSSMNIEDQTNLTRNNDTNDQQSNLNTTENNIKKLFPIFAKDHSSNINIFMDADKKTNLGVKRPHGWQLSAKASDSSQYQLDAGQKRFGSTQCPECNVVYQIGEPEDENAHLIFHNNIKKLRFNGWKNEHVVYEDAFTRSRIITLEPSDSKHCWNKVAEILSIVDNDLGLAESTLTDHHSKRVYLYIREKYVVGALVAEPIKIAHRMIPELIDLNCCEEEATTAKCGVNVIWTALNHRKLGIAKKLMDILRSHFYYGYIMSLDDIAFSIPTPAGKTFAGKYIGGRDFKVYS